ncbi:hypothetical protein BC831DRAFT_479733, partial [Entophlyctis helioformis]
MYIPSLPFSSHPIPSLLLCEHLIVCLYNLASHSVHTSHSPFPQPFVCKAGCSGPDNN